MELRRVLVIGSLGLGMALAGCGGASGAGTAAGATSPAATSAATAPSASVSAGASPMSSAPAAPASRVPAPPAAADGDARSALDAAARRLAKDTLRMRMDMGSLMSATGVADPSTGAMQMRIQFKGAQSMTMEARTTGRDVYLKFGGQLGASTGNQWLHIDGKELPRNLWMGSAEDPGDAKQLLQTVTQVRRNGPRSFSGTMDATKSSTANPRSVQAMGPKAKAVPFTAQVDAQGRLTGLTLRMDAINPSVPAMKVRYYDFGTPVAVTKPAGRVTEAPQALIDAFNR